MRHYVEHNCLTLCSRQLCFNGYNAFDLIAVWYTHETRPLVNNKADQSYSHGQQNKSKNDQMGRIRKQAASRAQTSGDRTTGNDSCCYGDRKDSQRDDLTGEIRYCRVRAIEQSVQIQGHPGKRIQPREYEWGQDKDDANDRSRFGVCKERVCLCRNWIRHIMASCLPAAYDRKQDQADGKQVKPHDQEQEGGEIFTQVSPVDDLHNDERQDDQQTNEPWYSDGLKCGSHNSSWRNKQQMLSNNSYGSFDERPKYKAEEFLFCSYFFITEVLERLLHGFE